MNRRNSYTKLVQIWLMLLQPLIPNVSLQEDESDFKMLTRIQNYLRDLFSVESAGLTNAISKLQAGITVAVVLFIAFATRLPTPTKFENRCSKVIQISLQSFLNDANYLGAKSIYKYKSDALCISISIQNYLHYLTPWEVWD